MILIMSKFTKHLLDDGGHEEGEGDHGGRQNDEAEGGACHHNVCRTVLLVIVFLGSRVFS